MLSKTERERWSQQTDVGHAKPLIDELERICATLPETADGYPILPGMKVWRKTIMLDLAECDIDGIITQRHGGVGIRIKGSDFIYPATEFYAIRANAEAAIEKAKEPK